MSINLSMPEPTLMHPRILVIGVGGAGGNAVNNMIEAELQGVDFVVANTDAQALTQSKAERKIQLGAQITQGLGAGSKPDVGRAAAEESLEQLVEHLSGAHMVFVTAGMGGGTGTGAAPVIAQLARERGILTVGVVTKPFQFEGGRRMAIADEGICSLQQYVDTLIVIPNQNLFRIANEKTTFSDAFAMADEVLHSGVRGVTDLMVMPGLINLDFADVRTVMAEMGKAVMGTGEAEGDARATEAAQAAISNPLLEDLSITGAQGVLINITGGMDMTLFEVDEAADHIRKEVDPDANIIVGSTFNDDITGRIRVSVVATGLDADAIELPAPGPRVTTLHSPARVSASMATEPSHSMQRPAMENEPVLPEFDNLKDGSAAQPQPVELAPALNAADEAKQLGATPIESVPGGHLTPVHEGGNLLTGTGVPGLDPQILDDEIEADPEPATATEAPILREILQTQKTPPIADANINESAPPSVRSSLFARVTGVGRNKAKKTESTHRQLGFGGGVKAAEPEVQDIREVPVTPAQSTAAIETAPASVGAPVKFSEVTPSERLVPPVSDDDQLEIPAFLRRQAN